MSDLSSGVILVRGLIAQLVEASSSLSSFFPQRSLAVHHLRQATAELHAAREAVGEDDPCSEPFEGAGRLSPKTRMVILQSAYQAAAVELLGDEGAALATYRLADRMVSRT